MLHPPISVGPTSPPILPTPLPSAPLALTLTSTIGTQASSTPVPVSQKIQVPTVSVPDSLLKSAFSPPDPPYPSHPPIRIVQNSDLDSYVCHCLNAFNVDHSRWESFSKADKFTAMRYVWSNYLRLYWNENCYFVKQFDNRRLLDFDKYVPYFDTNHPKWTSNNLPVFPSKAKWEVDQQKQRQEREIRRKMSYT